MENLEVSIDIRETVKVQVDPSEVLWAINDLPIGRKWGVIANVLDGIKLTEELTESQTEIIRKWLARQVERYGLPSAKTEA